MRLLAFLSIRDNDVLPPLIPTVEEVEDETEHHIAFLSQRVETLRKGVDVPLLINEPVKGYVGKDAITIARSGSRGSSE
jgi:hypothetical protein